MPLEATGVETQMGSLPPSHSRNGGGDPEAGDEAPLSARKEQD